MAPAPGALNPVCALPRSFWPYPARLYPWMSTKLSTTSGTGLDSAGAGSAAAVLHSRAAAALSAHPLRGAATLEALGTTLFREHLLALEATGLLLLAAMVAAVSLVKKEL